MRSFEVSILPAHWTFTAPEGKSLLASAEAAGIMLPSSCRNGTCRTCIAQVASGQVRHLIDWPGVSRDEQAAGWILPCVATPCSSVALLAPAACRLP